jgi:hypothetical protein
VRTVVCLLLLFVAQRAWAVDYLEYQRLTARANSLLEATRTASEVALPGLREAAIEADLAVLAWLDAYLADPEFAALDPAQQAAVRSDGYRWEYNLSVQLIALERCEEAAERLRGLVSGALEDEALSASLIGSYSEALECQARIDAARLCLVTLESATPGASVTVDGVPLGALPVQTELPQGPHSATFEAPGYVAEAVSFVADGNQTTVGPVTLRAVSAEVPPPPAGQGPEWYHWTAWGVGVAGVTTGVALFLTARDREDTVENPPPGTVITDLDAERDTIDALDRGAYVTGGIGLAAAIAGTILFLVGDDDAAEAVTPTALGGLPGLGFRF